MAKVFDYSQLPAELERQQARHRIFSVIVLAFGMLALLNCTYIEFLNVRAGSKLPFTADQLANDPHWRIMANRMLEAYFRQTVIRPTGDPSWETRPFTPAESADLRRLIARNNADARLSRMVPTAC